LVCGLKDTLVMATPLRGLVIALTAKTYSVMIPPRLCVIPPRLCVMISASLRDDSLRVSA